MMKRKIVLVEFPYDDLSGSKIRPAYCLGDPVGEYRHVLFALITSRIPNSILPTDLVLDSNHPDFMISGLKKSSTIRLDHLITLRRSMIQRQLGELSPATHAQIVDQLYDLVRE
jgi:mRNA interferase MazF